MMQQIRATCLSRFAAVWRHEIRKIIHERAADRAGWMKSLAWRDSVQIQPTYLRNGSFSVHFALIANFGWLAATGSGRCTEHCQRSSDRAADELLGSSGQQHDSIDLGDLG